MILELAQTLAILATGLVLATALSVTVLAALMGAGVVPRGR